MRSWIIRLWSAVALLLASAGALLGLWPFGWGWGVALSATALAAAVGLLLYGRRRLADAWPSGTRFFAWWAAGLSTLALILVLTLVGAVGSCQSELERATAELPPPPAADGS